LIALKKCISNCPIPFGKTGQFAKCDRPFHISVLHFVDSQHEINSLHAEEAVEFAEKF